MSPLVHPDILLQPKKKVDNCAWMYYKKLSCEAWYRMVLRIALDKA